MGIRDIFKRKKNTVQIDNASQKLEEIKKMLSNHMEKCQDHLKQNPTAQKFRTEFDLCQNFLLFLKS